MTAELQAALPRTVTEWETVLIGRFLRVGEDGDASPVRSFEITGETLAAAAGIEGKTAQEAEAAFKAALLADQNLWRALREGRCRPAAATLPNCFAYLAMTLLIDTLLEGDYSIQGQYRDRLRSWLSTTRSLMQLSGVAKMWRALTAWLEVRIDEGEPFRRLALPRPPRSWTQIGYTRRLSFPTRADVRFLDRVMAGFRRGTSDPPGLIRAIEGAIDRGGASWGMRTAFEEFRTAFRAGTASTDHRFWRLVQRAKRNVRQAISEEVVLELGCDEDGRRSISVGPPGDEVAIKAFDDLGVAMRSELVTRSQLAAAAGRGIIFFRQVGMARWRAQSNPPSGRVATHLAFSSAVALRVHSVLALVQSGDWLLTAEPVWPGTVDDILSRLGLIRLREEQLLDIALFDGVHTGNAWLGRRDFLPRIEAGDRLIQVTRLAGQGAGSTISVRDGTFRSDATVEGAYEVAATVVADGRIPGWSRHVRFVADAIPHDEMAGVAYREPPVRECLGSDLVHVRRPSYDELEWAEDDLPSADLLEAVYAAGRSGLAEGKLVDLVARGSSGRAEPWSLLRSLQESGFLDPRYRRRWRGRVWTLGRPTLIQLGDGMRRLVVVEGAVCSVLEREFYEVARGHGGRPFRRLGPSPWIPAVIGAVDVEPDALAARLGWPTSPQVREPRMRPLALETSHLVAEHHVLASSWDWDRRRFVTGATGPCEVSLTRWVHPGGRDHDVFRVRSAGHTSSHMTRTTAILTAHMVARVPLFRMEEGMLLRTSMEGALPLEFARSLRLTALAGGGVIGEGGYAYPLGGYDVTGLSQALPGCIETVGDCRSPSSSMDVLLAARRSGGRHRVRWVDGGIKVDP